mgnify:CR=1 FL=1
MCTAGLKCQRFAKTDSKEEEDPGDVGGVGSLPVLGLNVVDHQPHGKPQEAVEGPY